MAWLAPLTVAATALAIWINVRDDGAVRPEAARESTVASALERPTLGAGADLPRESAKAEVPVQTFDRLEKPVPGSAPSAAAVAPAERERAASGLAPPPAAEPQAPAADATANRLADAEAPAGPSTPLEIRQARAFASRADATIISLNRTSQWRLGVRGEVQHSADGGMTWQAQGTGVTVAPTAGFSPAPSVCWLVGPAGLVLITTDEGRNWRRLPFPIDTDLASVRATDHLSATIAAADGRTFVTSDGGATWRR